MITHECSDHLSVFYFSWFASASRLSSSARHKNKTILIEATQACLAPFGRVRNGDLVM